MIRVRKKTLRIIEFLLIGVAVGLVEDLIAVKAVSGEPITIHVIGTVLLVAVPFAILSELVVDHPRFWEILRISRDEDGAAEKNGR